MLASRWRATALVVATVCAGGVLLASPADAAGPPWAGNRAGLTNAQAKEVWKGSRAMGLTDAQAKTVLANRRVALGVPVRFDDSVNTSAPPTRPATAGVATTTFAAAAVACDTITARRDGRNILGQRLYTFWGQKYWCWDGGKVSYTPPAWYWGEVTGLSSVAWAYKGTTADVNVDQIPVPGGFWVSHSWAQAHFEGCLLRVGCFQNTYPLIRMWGYGNGYWAWRAQG
jgi:hypothetical protein